MTTCRDLIDRAGRQLGVLAAGETASGDDAADLMRHLQDLIVDLPLLLDGAWDEVRLTSALAYEASDGQRIVRGAYPGAVITLPTTAQDGARVQIVGGPDAGLYVFVAELAAWSRIDNLSIADESPFGRKDDAGLAALICASAAEEYGVPLGPVAAQRAQRAIAAFRARFYRPILGAAEPALPGLSSRDLG
ncbi:hypothetical protein [Phenylobacterium immobile]|uniref:hypothetical protein n=1 Tax=Phenylobacterium immobile TaxID=21 RepID=UPI000A593D12|nr:hypothetical protein [Phenylobacterium immobile]